ncbi:O-antigen ligase family protein [Sphingomonas sp. NPDC019816]|uniref:O-antigen ligase family protein n=1 Tax=Sphingomonas sp. NPDC019816 TaxID=3390679 RepID=UPI003D05ECCB
MTWRTGTWPNAHRPNARRPTANGAAAGTAKSSAALAGWTAAPFSGLIFLLLMIRFGMDRALMGTSISLGSANFTLGILFNFAFVFIAFTLLGFTLFSNRAMQSDAALPLALWLPFLASLFASVLYTAYPMEGIKFFWNVLTYFCLFVVGVHYSRYFTIGRIAEIVILTGIFPILVSLGFLVTDGFGQRLQGAAGHPNMLAFFLFFYVSVGYHGIIWGWIRAKAIRYIAIPFCGLATLELLLTGTRSAFVALFAFILVSTLRRPALLLLVLPAPLLALAIPSVNERVTEVFHADKPTVSYEYFVATARGDTDSEGGVQADSGMWRMFLWKAAWPVILEAPLLGHGASSFLPSSQEFFPLNASGGSGAHNIYVQILFEQGFVGLFAYLWLVLGVCAVAIMRWRYNPSVAVFVLMIVLCFGVASFSDNMLYYLIDQIYIWFISGFALGVLTNAKAHERRAVRR